MTDDFYLPPVTTAPTPLALTDEERRTRRNRVLMFAGVLLCVAAVLVWTGEASPPREMQLEFGKYLGMVLVVSIGYYHSFKHKPEKP